MILKMFIQIHVGTQEVDNIFYLKSNINFIKLVPSLVI